MTIKRLSLFLVFASIVSSGYAQTDLLKKSWIAVYIEEFRKAPPQSDTAYVRYTFENKNVLIGFEPAWHMSEIPYSVWKKKLTVGFDEWKIETLTDTALTIYMPGFRRMKFVAEKVFQNDEIHLIQIGEHNGKPLYKANQIITPRYKKPNMLMIDLTTQDRSGDYNIRTAGNFIMTFIVTEEGNVEDPKIIKGVAPGYDASTINALLKTSKQWTPAMFRGKPVQTRVVFEKKFVDTSLENRHSKQ